VRDWREIVMNRVYVANLLVSPDLADAPPPKTPGLIGFVPVFADQCNAEEYADEGDGEAFPLDFARHYGGTVIKECRDN
jgi:hypothetical protein